MTRRRTLCRCPRALVRTATSYAESRAYLRSVNEVRRWLHFRKDEANAHFVSSEDVLVLLNDFCQLSLAAGAMARMNSALNRGI